MPTSQPVLPWADTMHPMYVMESDGAFAVVVGTTPADAEANLRRIIACFNACDGIETFFLEAMGKGTFLRARDRAHQERTAHSKLVQAVLDAFDKKRGDAPMRTDGVFDNDVDALALQALEEFVARKRSVDKADSL